MMPPLLEIKDLRVHFPGARQGFWKRCEPVRAVDGVDLHILRGEALGIVGESGCGKSTLGRVIVQLIRPTAGQVLLEGQPLGRWNGRVQMIFQDPYSSLNPRRTIGQTLAEPLRVHRICKPGQVAMRVRGAVDEVGLPDATLAKYPHELSGGQRQRVAIARALITQPDLVVADEAVSALDVSVRAQVLNLLKHLQQSRRLSMLFISHDLAVVRYLCERTAVMYRGVIVESAPTRDVLDKPSHPYTRELRAASLFPDPAA